MSRSTASTRSVRAAVAAVLGVSLVVLATPRPASAATTVAVNGGTTYQTVDGFGISEAFGQANAIRNVGDSTVQTQMLTMLFSRYSGAGFSILRNIIPSDSSHTMEPTAPSSPSATPTYVWDGDDDATDWGQLWLAKRARSYGVSTFYNDAWSAPGFMKTNGDESNGGYLCGAPGTSCSSGDWRQAYANYLVQHAKNWSYVGLTPAYLGFVNEPTLSTSYSSMLMYEAQATDFVKVLGPTLASSGLSTKLTCCDTLGWGKLGGYVNSVLADSTAASYPGIYTSHGYSSAPTYTVSTGGKKVWMTEWSTGNDWNAAWDDGSADSGFTWAKHIHTGMTAANLSAFLYFWGVSNTGKGSALIALSGTTVTPAKRFYSFVNYSRFIRPGAVRIAASSGDSNLDVSSYKNTDGSVVVTVLNESTSAISTTYSLSNTGISSGTAVPYLTNGSYSTAAQSSISFSSSFTATVPARSLVTYHLTSS